MKVVGVINSQGEFNGNKYHNLVLHCVTNNDNEKKDVCGKLTETVKVRYSDLNSLFGLGLADPADVEKIQASAFSDYIGAEISVAYNKFGAVQAITVIRMPDKSPDKK